MFPGRLRTFLKYLLVLDIQVGEILLLNLSHILRKYCDFKLLRSSTDLYMCMPSRPFSISVNFAPVECFTLSHWLIINITLCVTNNIAEFTLLVAYSGMWFMELLLTCYF